MNAGRLNRRVTFQRLQDLGPRDRGAWQDLLSTWAQYRPGSAGDESQGGRRTNVEAGTLTVRFPGPASDVTVADRVLLEGRPRAITSVGTPDRHAGTLEIGITTDLET